MRFGANVDFSFVTAPGVFVVIEFDHPNIARGVDHTGFEFADFAWTATDEGLESDHIGDDGREEWQGRGDGGIFHGHDGLRLWTIASSSFQWSDTSWGLMDCGF